MKRRERHILYLFLAIIDALLIVASYVTASSAYVGTLNALGRLAEYHVPLMHNAGFLALAVYAFLTVAAYAACKVYGAAYLGCIGYMARRVVAVNTIGIVLFAAVLYVLHMDNVSRLTLLLFYLFSTAVVLLRQWIAVQIFYRRRKDESRLSPIIVVGSGPLAMRYAEAIGSSSARMEHVIGYIAPQDSFPHAVVAKACPLLRDRLGSVPDLGDVLAQQHIDGVVIALETEDYPCVREVMAAADTSGVGVSMVPFYNDIIPRRPDLDSVQGVKIVNLRSMPLDSPFNAAMKRMADVVVSALVLVCLSWLFVLVAAGVKIASPGPVLFRQTRTGRNGKSFEMLKFRSMRVAEGDVNTFSEDKEERKTKFGRFIRKFSIDELPQFVNVLKGDMSVIGPRPVVGEETSAYAREIPLYMLRHQVRPGISGWAQVNGYRGDNMVDQAAKRTELDLWYIQHWSAWLDIKIFFRTIFGGFVNSERL